MSDTHPTIIPNRWQPGYVSRSWQTVLTSNWRTLEAQTTKTERPA